VSRGHVVEAGDRRMQAHALQTRRPLLTALSVTALALALAVPVASAAPMTKLVSQQYEGHQSASPSGNPDIDASGNTVVFDTRGDEFSGGDSNGFQDVYRRIIDRSKAKMVSRAYVGGLGDAPSFAPSISSNGRYVVFQSAASNLTPTKITTGRQIYRRDLVSRKTRLVSTGAKGVGDRDAWTSDVSASGRYVAFSSWAYNLTSRPTFNQEQVYLRDMVKKKTFLISQSGGVAGNGPSGDPVVSADGRFVAFTSMAKNLSGKDLRNASQIFMRDRKLGKTYLISKNSKGKAGNDYSWSPAMAADGRTIVFASNANNLIKWGADSNTTPDVYKYDRARKVTSRVSVSRRGRQLNGDSFDPDISANGKVIVFASNSTNVIKGGSDAIPHIYRRGLTPGSIKIASRNNNGKQGNGPSNYPKVSANGRWVTYESNSTNLNPGKDDNGSTTDAFRTGPF
jgi:Tol biopolymer transport system component